jgi:hypothetical protein
MQGPHLRLLPRFAGEESQLAQGGRAAGTPLQLTPQATGPGKGVRTPHKLPGQAPTSVFPVPLTVSERKLCDTAWKAVIVRSRIGWVSRFSHPCLMRRYCFHAL